MTQPIVVVDMEDVKVSDTESCINSKRFLKVKRTYKKGDFVTINDDNDVIDVYFVESVDGNILTLCGIELTVEKDDVIPYSFEAHKSEILYVGESFVNAYGALWNMRKRFLSIIG